MYSSFRTLGLQAGRLARTDVITAYNTEASDKTSDSSEVDMKTLNTAQDDILQNYDFMSKPVSRHETQKVAKVEPPLKAESVSLLRPETHQDDKAEPLPKPVPKPSPEPYDDESESENEIDIPTSTVSFSCDCINCRLDEAELKKAKERAAFQSSTEFRTLMAAKVRAVASSEMMHTLRNRLSELKRFDIPFVNALWARWKKLYMTIEGELSFQPLKTTAQQICGLIGQMLSIIKQLHILTMEILESCHGYYDKYRFGWFIGTSGMCKAPKSTSYEDLSYMMNFDMEPWFKGLILRSPSWLGKGGCGVVH